MNALCPYCNRQFTVPPHREKDPAYPCPNCGAMVKARRPEKIEGEPKPLRATPGVLTMRQKLPEHKIAPAECEVVQELSRRGSGITYLAKHPEVQEGHVLLKVFLPEYTVSEETTARWTRVCKMAEELRHPRLARILGVGLMEGVPCVVREYIEGKTFEEMLKEGSLDLKQGIFYLAQALEGIEDAHGHRIVHGNLKPSNIIVDSRGRAVIADIGLYPPPDAPDTSEHLLTSLPYMAPELLSGTAPAKPAADVYSAAAVLYDMAANRPPFVATTIQEMRRNKLAGNFIPPTRISPKTSKTVEFLIAQNLAVNPEQRYGSLHALVVDFHRVYKGQKPLSYEEKKNPFVQAAKTLFYMFFFLGLLGGLGWGVYKYWLNRVWQERQMALVDAGKALERGDYNYAATLAAGLADTPLSNEARLLEAAARLNLKQMDRVIALAEKSLQANLGPDADAKAQWLKIRAFIGLGRIKEARATMGEVDAAVFGRLVRRVEIEAFVADAANWRALDAQARTELREFLVDDLLPKVNDPAGPALIKRAAAGLADDASRAALLYREALSAPGQDQSTLNATAAAFAELFMAGDLKLTAQDAEALSASPDVLSRLGQELMLRGLDNEADFAWKALSGKQNLPDSAQRMLRLLEARTLEMEGRTSEALNRYLDLQMKNDAAGLWALSLAARLRLNSGDVRSAAADFKSIEGDASGPAVLREQASMFLGHCWRAQGRSDQALSFYRKASRGQIAGRIALEATMSEIEALVETGSMDEAKRIGRNLKNAASESVYAAAASFLLKESEQLPSDLPRHYALYLKALRLEVEQRWPEAAEAYRAVEVEAEGKSWYAQAAKYRKALVRSK